jgi:hypothetical protein
VRIERPAGVVELTVLEITWAAPRRRARSP